MIPWRDWFCFAVAGLGLSPGEFWRLTLAEWRWLAAQEAGPALSREELARLILQHRDKS